MLETYFEIKKRGSDLKTELIAGATTFLTMSYIIVVNPMILKKTGMSFDGALFATVLVSSISSILMGLYANLPYALAPGMGINAFFTFTLCYGMGISWQAALGAVFLSGLVFVLLTITKVRTAVVQAIPECLRYAVAAGIGLFLALIGLSEVGFIRTGATIVSFGGFNPNTLLFYAGLIITSVLVAKGIKGALLISIFINSAISILISIVGLKSGFLKHPIAQVPVNFISLPKPELFLKFDLLETLRLGMIAPVFTLLFTDMFDSISTFVGVAHAGGLVDKDGQPLSIDKALMVDALATVFSGIFGTSSATTYIESASGVKEGGRTGITAIVAGLLFLPFMFLSPILSLIPSVATSPVLLIVGVFMTQTLRNIKWDRMDEAIPAFVAFILIPLTYSITQGIVWGFLTYTFLKVLTGKAKEISTTLLVIDIFAIVALILLK